MKTIAIMLLAASFVSAAIPYALAATCVPPREELAAIQGQLPEDTYVYDVRNAGTDPQALSGKAGVWEESNGLEGLQTATCKQGTITIFRADTQTVPP